eukprot:3849058-Rhodomonas_salina.1
MPQVYDLTLPEDFEGGVKNWEAYDGVIISTLMDVRLSIIVDIVSAVVTALYRRRESQRSSGTLFLRLTQQPLLLLLEKRQVVLVPMAASNLKRFSMSSC